MGCSLIPRNSRVFSAPRPPPRRRPHRCRQPPRGRRPSTRSALALMGGALSDSAQHCSQCESLRNHYLERGRRNRVPSGLLLLRRAWVAVPTAMLRPCPLHLAPGRRAASGATWERSNNPVQPSPPCGVCGGFHRLRSSCRTATTSSGSTTTSSTPTRTTVTQTATKAAGPPLRFLGGGSMFVSSAVSRPFLCRPCLLRTDRRVRQPGQSPIGLDNLARCCLSLAFHCPWLCLSPHFHSLSLTFHRTCINACHRPLTPSHRLLTAFSRTFHRPLAALSPPCYH